MRTRRKKKGEKRKSDCKDAKGRCMHTCGEKFSEDFPMCIKIAENTRINNHSKHTRIYVETQKEKTTGGREILL